MAINQPIRNQKAVSQAQLGRLSLSAEWKWWRERWRLFRGTRGGTVMGDGRGTGLPPADTSSCREPAQDGEIQTSEDAAHPGTKLVSWQGLGNVRSSLRSSHLPPTCARREATASTSEGRCGQEARARTGGPGHLPWQSQLTVPVWRAQSSSC